tara:strand:- start:93 stop:245 length:153 start_codon:yes stop_codon:yes gene_type:complete
VDDGGHRGLWLLLPVAVVVVVVLLLLLLLLLLLQHLHRDHLLPLLLGRVE